MAVATSEGDKGTSGRPGGVPRRYDNPLTLSRSRTSSAIGRTAMASQLEAAYPSDYPPTLTVVSPCLPSSPSNLGANISKFSARILQTPSKGCTADGFGRRQLDHRRPP